MMTAAEKARRDAAEAGGAEILALAEPYLWTDRVRATYSEYVLEGIVKLPSDADPSGPASQTRAALLQQAERLLDALTGAGWQPVDEIRLNLATETDRCKQALDGTVVIPSAQVATTLLLELRLNLERYQIPAVLQDRVRVNTTFCCTGTTPGRNQQTRNVTREPLAGKPDWCERRLVGVRGFPFRGANHPVWVRLRLAVLAWSFRLRAFAACVSSCACVLSRVRASCFRAWRCLRVARRARMPGVT